MYVCQDHFFYSLDKKSNIFTLTEIINVYENMEKLFFTHGRK